jgi:hypothetical protein
MMHVAEIDERSTRRAIETKNRLPAAGDEPARSESKGLAENRLIELPSPTLVRGLTPVNGLALVGGPGSRRDVTAIKPSRRLAR